MCNSSHSFAEHQQQHAVYQTSSTVDRVVVTTARSEIYSVVSKLMTNDVLSREEVSFEIIQNNIYMGGFLNNSQIEVIFGQLRSFF